jgi:hypothetical protein
MNQKLRSILESKVKRPELTKAVLVRLPLATYDGLKKLQVARINESIESGDSSTIGVHTVIIQELNRVVGL